MLKPCPFCGSPAQISLSHFPAQGTCNQKYIPEDAKIIKVRTIGQAHPHTQYIYEKVAYVPQCSDQTCIGRVRKKYHTEQEAENAWNRRTK